VKSLNIQENLLLDHIFFSSCSIYAVDDHFHLITSCAEQT